MNATTAPRRLCFPSGYLLSGVNARKVSAVCHCGFVTTPRVSVERADEALEVEHGWTDSPNGCAVCRLQPDARRPWDVFKPLAVRAKSHEVWVCKDFGACSAREEAAYAADKLTCGCKLVYVTAFGHYHSPQLMSDVAGGEPK
jgi:hypothetical protein